MSVEKVVTEFPENWSRMHLKHCLEKLSSGKLVERGWSPQCLSRPTVDAWGVLKTTAIQMGEFLPEYNKELPTSLEPKTALEVNNGDFLLTTTGPRNRCGVVCHVQVTPKNLIFSGKILRFRADENVIRARWLMFILMSPEYQKTFDRLKVGTSDSSVSIGNQQVLELELIVPPVVEQEKIVEILEEQFSRLNAALDSINIMKSKIEQLQGSLTEAAMDGNSLTEFAGDWEVKLLGDLVNHKSDIVDGPFGSNLKSEHYVGAGARVVRLQNIGYGDFRNEKAFITEEHFERLKKHNVVGGDLLFASLGERLPRTCLMPDLDAPAIVKADCIRIRLSPGVNNRFILYATQSPTARVWASEQLHGLGRPRLGLGNIRAFPVRIPSLEVQDRIVNFLDEQFSRLDASLAVAEAIEKKSSALRRSLLHAERRRTCLMHVN
jgi:type I restriction enzyme S subunit